MKPHVCTRKLEYIKNTKQMSLFSYEKSLKMLEPLTLHLFASHPQIDWNWMKMASVLAAAQARLSSQLLRPIPQNQIPITHSLKRSAVKAAPFDFRYFWVSSYLLSLHTHFISIVTIWCSFLISNGFLSSLWCICLRILP